MVVKIRRVGDADHARLCDQKLADLAASMKCTSIWTVASVGRPETRRAIMPRGAIGQRHQHAALHPAAAIMVFVLGDDRIFVIAIDDRSHNGPIRFRNPLVSTTVQPSAFSFSSAILSSSGLLSGARGYSGFRAISSIADASLVKRNGRLAEGLGFDDDGTNENMIGREVRPMRGLERVAFDAAARVSALAASLDGASAQTYPNRTITLVVPFPPGGQHLDRRTGQSPTR